MSSEGAYNTIGEIIETKRDDIYTEGAYNEEKKRMQAFVVRDDDIINLNVGGKKFTTKRSTLCQVEGSLFATMFSGRWEESVERDQNGAVFFDFNPQYFGFMLDYLREKKIATPENPPSLPKVPKDHMKRFYRLVEYLGLSDEIVPTEKFNLHSPGVTLEEDGKVAVHDETEGYKYVLGENIYQQGIVNLKLKLEWFKYNHWIFIGIVKGDVVPRDDKSNGWPGSYGWALGHSRFDLGAWKDGSLTGNITLENLTKQGDEVQLILDFNAAKLSLHLTTGEQFHIDIPKNKTWRLNVNMLYPNDKIRIMNEW